MQLCLFMALYWMVRQVHTSHTPVSISNPAPVERSEVVDTGHLVSRTGTCAGPQVSVSADMSEVFLVFLVHCGCFVCSSASLQPCTFELCRICGNFVSLIAFLFAFVGAL